MTQQAICIQIFFPRDVEIEKRIPGQLDLLIDPASPGTGEQAPAWRPGAHGVVVVPCP